MAGILYVVATPIGNLEDVTLRALRILREVSVIAAEDTRRTAKRLQHYSISTRTTSLHEHNEREKAPHLIERLLSGESIALVSDAGTPTISDPGQSLIAMARTAAIKVESVPGPSAIMAALSASGLPAREFSFAGFPPHRSKDRASWMHRVAGQRQLVIFFEAPHRIRQTLHELSAVVVPTRSIGIGRELTKSHEELVVQPISTALSALSSLKGEFTVLLPPAESHVEANPELPDKKALTSELGHITENTYIGRRDGLRILADKYKIGVNDLYKVLHGDG